MFQESFLNVIKANYGQDLIIKLKHKLNYWAVKILLNLMTTKNNTSYDPNKWESSGICGRTVIMIDYKQTEIDN